MAAGVGPPRSGALMAACSIIIPTHNRLALVHQAAASALAALFPGGVVDDGPTSPVAAALAERVGPSRRVLVNPGGAAQARNFGTGRARGGVVFCLDDDDPMVPCYTEAMLALAVAQTALTYHHSASRTLSILPRAPDTGPFHAGNAV